MYRIGSGKRWGIDMDAGRELDALVAEKVMGYRLSFIHPITGAPLYSNGGGSFSFRPSTDIDAAWEVVMAVEGNVRIAQGKKEEGASVGS